MVGSTKTLRQQLAEKLVRTGIAILALLILRGIASLMPMLRNELIYVTPFPGYSALFDPTNPASVLATFRQLLNDPRFQNLFVNPQTQALLNEQWNRGSIALALQAQNEILMAEHLAIFPITVIKAVVDTLIFGLLFVLGRSITHLFRAEYARLPDLGQMINLCLITGVAGIAYHSYKGVGYPLVLPDNTAVYNWTFGGLAMLPLVLLAVVVSRNMDSITALVMHSGPSVVAATGHVATVRCSNCGKPMAAAAKFCGNCGTASGWWGAAVPAQRCSSCGAENPPGAKFCKECGHPVYVATA